MSAHVFTSGMVGNAETNLLNYMPGTGQGSEKNTNSAKAFKSEPIAPKLLTKKFSAAEAACAGPDTAWVKNE